MTEQAREPMSEPLVEQLESTREAMRRYRRAATLVWIALAVLAFAAIIILADWIWVLARSTRALGLLLPGITAFIIFDRLILRHARRFGRQEAAAEVESGFPTLGQRVRTTLEYLEPGPDTAPASPTLVRALRVDTGRRTSQLDFRSLIPWRALRGPIAGLAVLILMGSLFLAGDPELRIAARRFLLLPASYTQLAVKPGDDTIKEGRDFTVQATITGRPVREAHWYYRRAGRDDPWTTVSLAPGGTQEGEGKAAPLSGTLTGTLKNCRDDLEYRVVAGPVESPIYRLRINHPLVLKALEADIEPPAYTRKPRTTAKAGDLRIIEGSKVGFRITLDRAPRSAELVLTEKSDNEKPRSRAVPLHVEGTTLTGELPEMLRPLEYQVVARADDGMELEPRRYAIRVQPDEKPALRFVKPPEELAVIATTEVPMHVEAADDFGLTRVGIVFQIGKGPKETLLLDEHPNQPLTAQALATLYLEKHKIDLTRAITYYAFAEDNHPKTPNRTTTELRFIDILPFKQEYQFGDGQSGQSGSSPVLEELIARERTILGRTFTQADEPTVDPETARRLATLQAKLKDTTAEYTEGLEARFGPVPSLHDAIAAMVVAASELEEKNLKKAMPEEETALASLIKARMNMRKLLANSQTASALRRFNRQEQQKFRDRPPKKDDALAQLPQELKKLAQEEREIAERASGTPPSDSSSRSQAGSPSAAERQAKAADAARALGKTMRDDPALSDLARTRMDEAKETVEKSADDLRAGNAKQGAEHATRAAERLEQLADQVAGLKARDLAEKLAQARNLAQRLAKDERDIAKQTARGPEKDAADRQRRLSDNAETLVDWLRRFQTDSADESRPLSQALRQAARANPPREIADDMRQTADALAQGQNERAAARADRSAQQLSALAQDLDSARRAFVQPQLDELLAAEKQASATQAALKSVHDEADKDRAEKAILDLRKTMDGLKANDPALARAAEALDEKTQQRGGWGGIIRPHDFQPGDQAVLAPPVAYTEGVSSVLITLQAKIQELILKEVLTDRDEGVPPQYKSQVEDYYRTLSEDLR